MDVNDNLIDKLAHLAKLNFNDSEKQQLKGDLQKMITFIANLEVIDTTDVEPLLHITSNVNTMREDVADGMVSQQDALLNAPKQDGKFFTVPKVIKKIK